MAPLLSFGKGSAQRLVLHFWWSGKLFSAAVILSYLKLSSVKTNKKDVDRWTKDEGAGLLNTACGEWCPATTASGNDMSDDKICSYRLNVKFWAEVQLYSFQGKKGLNNKKESSRHCPVILANSNQSISLRDNIVLDSFWCGLQCCTMSSFVQLIVISAWLSLILTSFNRELQQDLTGSTTTLMVGGVVKGESAALLPVKYIK